MVSFLTRPTALRRAAAIVAPACLIACLALIRISGAPISGFLLFVLGAAGYIYLPGRFFSRLSGLEDKLPGFETPLAILYGSGFFAIAYAAGVRLGLVWPVRLAVPLPGLIWLIPQLRSTGKKRPLRAKTGTSAFHLLVLLWAGLSLLATLALDAQSPHPVAAGGALLHQDMLWNVGNANAFMLAFPAQDIRFAGVRFHYHYLTELLVSGLAAVSGQSAFNVFFYYLPPVMLAALLACVWGLGLHFYAGSRAKALALCAGLFGFGCASLWGVYGLGRSIFGNTMLEHLVTNINAQATALCFIAVFFVLFCEMARRRFAVNARFILTWLCSFVMVCMAKGPQAAILLCSLVVTMLLVLLFQKPAYGRALLCLSGAVAVFAVAYRFIFSSGANTSMHFDIFSVASSPVYRLLAPLTDILCRLIPGSGYFWLALICTIHIFCMAPFQFALWLRGLPGHIRRLFRLDAGRILANGAVAGGALAYFLFWHANSSQVYFALLSIFFAALLGFDQLPRLRGRRIFALLGKTLGAVGLASSLMLASVMAGGGLRQLGRTLAHTPPQSDALVCAADERAAEWLRANSPQNAVFATNRIHGAPASGSGISNLYSAISGRQAFMEGYTYAISNMGVSRPVVEQRIAANAALFDAATPPAEAVRIARQNGVDYLIFNRRWQGSTASLSAMQLCFDEGDVAVYRVPHE